MDRFEDIYELSPMQQGMLFHTLYAPGSGMYCEQLACTLAGDLDAAAFERSWQQVVDRHPVLRTGFHWQELAKPLQVVHGRVEVPWLREDWRELPAGAQEARLQEILAADRRRGFALDLPPLLRLSLFRTGGASHRFVLSFHHILMDGWCLPLVFREVLMSYEASRRGEVPRIARPRPYRDFIAWLQRRPTEGEEAFWRWLLAGFRASTPLPGEASPAVPDAGGEVEGFAERREALGHHESAALHLLARSHQLTINTVVQAAWGLLLSRSSGERDVVFGATTSGRPAELPDVERMIGVFINTLPVRVSSSDEAAVLPWLRELQDRQAEVREHEHTPLTRIQAWSEVPQGQPLFESILVFENQPVDALATQERSFQIRDVQVEERTNYPLTLVVLPGPPLRLRAVYDRRRLSADGVARLLGHLRTLLTALAADDAERRLGDLSLLTEAERHQLLHEWAAAEPAAGDACLHRLFAAHAARSPEAAAVTHGGDSLTYRELNRRANRLAHHLLSLGVGPDVLVGLCLKRSPDLVTAILATLKAGGAYVPIDPVYPAERIGYLLADSRAAVLVTDGPLAGRLPAHGARVLDLGMALAGPGNEGDPEVEVSPGSLAYVIYTSGSTGRPKGVMVTHRNVVRLFTATESWLGFGPEDVWTLFHSYAFDFSVWEIWGALLYGGRVVVVPHWTSRSPDAFLELLGRESVTVLNQTPSAFRQLLRAEEAAGGPLPPLRWVVFGGEALDLPGLAPWFARHGDERPRLVNMYGITETTVHVTWRPLSAADVRGGSVIGGAIPDLCLRVLDTRGEPAPIGVAGEIHVGGAGLARGYLGRPELTAERFVPDPFAGPAEPGARLYRTGDLALLRPDGDLEYLGRIDHQVKIRGFRIELGEIEAALAEHPAVREAVVAVRGDGDDGDERRLVAWFVAAGEAPGAEALRAFLKTRLPDHMIPAAFLALDALPLTPHGKVDRRALPEPGQGRPDLGLAYVAPRTPFEEVLAAVWARALGLDRVGIDDDFFTLGGDSIRSVRVLALAREKGIDLSLEQIFGHPSVRELAAVLEGRAEASPESPGRTGGDLTAAPFSLIAEKDRRRLPNGVEDAYPLTVLQGGMLFHNELAPESGFYQNVTAFRLRGPLEPEALRAAVSRMAARHPVLRTSFELHAYGEPLQLVHRTAEIPVTFADLRQLDPAAREAALAARFEEEKARRFECTRAPLLRFHVDRLSEDEFELTLVEHHAILDGWSVAVLLSEIFRQYLFLLGRTEAPLPPPPANGFRSYVALEGEVLASEETRHWWARNLDGADPCALPRWPGRAAAEGPVRRLSMPLPRAVGEGLEAFARRTGVPFKSTVLAAHLRVLSLLTGRPDVVSGLVSDGRPEEMGAEQTLGLFVNTLPFRLVLAPGSWSDLASAVFAAERAMLPHRRFPLGELQREHGGAPLYEAVFNYVHFHVFQGIAGLSDFELRGLRAFQVTELVFIAELSRDSATSQLRLSLEYGSGHLNPAQIELFAGYYARALGAMAADPEARHDATPLLAEAERHQILAEWNNSAAALPATSFVEVFRARAERSPGATAVVFGARSLTYGDLAGHCERVARGLIAAGAAPDTLIALLAERSADFLTAMIGAFQAGAAYLPLDPHHPLDRLSRLLADSGAPLAVADRPRAAVLAQAVAALPAERRPRLLVLEDLIAGESPARIPLPPADGSRLAYAIYTSGSTGRPKGALVEHRGMVNHLWAKVLALGLTADDAVAQTAPQGFDISVWQFLAALLAGGRVHVLPDEVAHDPQRLIAEVERSGLTVLETVPSLLRLLLEELERQPSVSPALAGLRWMIPTGEALPAELCRRWLRLSPGIPLLNAYGPTECSDDVTHHTIRDEPRTERPVMPIGRPVANLRLSVLDASLGPLPAGVPGELYVAGAGVGRGYLGDGGRTAEVFVPDPFSGDSGEPGGRLYRTGDLARLAPDGTIEFLGRIDHQVKIRGHRIELGEIETALAAHSAVRAAVAAVREDAPGEPRLVAYVVPCRLEAPEETDAVAELGAELRDFLAGRLPEAMVPTAFVVLDELPLTPNGKLDRRALPPPEAVEPAREAPFAPPRTPTEEILAAIFADVLGRERLGIHDDFFELGGHSLLATRVISWARNTFQVELPLRSLFEHPTVAGLAPVLETALRSGGAAAAPPIRPAPRRPGDDLSLSFAQQRLWFLDQLTPANPFYNVPTDVWVSGALNVPVLARTVAEVVRRHEALRTTFPITGGGPVQRISPSFVPPLPLLDLRALPPQRAHEEAQRLILEEARRPFDLARGPLIRTALVRVADEQHAFLATMHHIVADGWSGGVLRRELAEIYSAFANNLPSPLSEMPIQYADFALWQRRWLQGEVLQAQLDYWRERLGDPPALDLPTDRPRPPVATFRGGEKSLRLSPELAADLRTLGRRHGATLFMVLLALWKVLLHRYTGQTDLMVGIPIANRNRSEIEGLIGFFVNTLVLRTDLSGAPSFLGLVERLWEVTLGAYAHQDLPFEMLVEELHPDRDISRNPIFQIAFTLQNFPVPDVRVPALAMRPLEVGHATAKFDLSLFTVEDGGGLLASFEHSLDLFDSPTIGRMLQHFRCLAEAVVAGGETSVAHLPFLPEAERHQLLAEWNDTTAGPGEGVVELFEAQVERSAESVAVVFGDQRLSYQEINRLANRLAHRLWELGVGPGARVGLCAERSPELVTGLLGILKAGGAYVPLDPAHPRARLTFLCADSAVATLVTQERLVPGLPRFAGGGPRIVCLDGLEEAPSPKGNPLRTAGPADLAYMIYTSGTTGQPKAVMVEHGSLAATLAATRRLFAFGPGNRMPCIAPFSFDIFLFELLSPLLTGGTSVLFPLRPALDIEALTASLSKATTLHAVPALMRQVVDAVRRKGPLPAAEYSGLRTLFVGGDAVPADLLADLRETFPQAQIWVLYGPTEGTILCSAHPVPATGPARPLLGRPLDGARLLLCDRHGQPVPAGVPGEVWIGGAGVTRGYWNRDELTAEKFVTRGGGRFFRTGDLARRMADGNLEFLGRIDQQVKIRGFRIELGEIESLLARHAEVHETVVAALDDPSGAGTAGKRLVAYVVRRPTAADEALASQPEAAEHIAEWQTLYDETYGRYSQNVDPTFNIEGWNSSYTGEPIPAEEMREWVESTVARILALGRRRVLEVGCGTGLLLLRIAPHAELYLGTDFSRVALGFVQRHLDRAGREGRALPQVSLAQGTADDWSAVSQGDFDLVVLNSVAQYFPGIDYLVRVLEGAVRAVAAREGGGAVFVGDVRSLPLLEALQTSVELHKAVPSLTVSELRRRVRRRAANEEELVVDPGLFSALARRLPEIRRVEMLVKRGRYHNELTRFRYDVVLHVAGPEARREAPVLPWIDWCKEDLSIPALERLLTGSSPDALALTGIPNGRLATEVTALALLFGPGQDSETVEDLREEIAERLSRPDQAGAAVDPEEIWALGERLGYIVELTWAGPDGAREGRLAAVLRRRGSEAAERVSLPAAHAPIRPWSAYANDPLRGRVARRLVPELRRFLQSELPEYMVPSSILLLDSLPLTPHGKVDRNALPAPEIVRSEAGAHVPPRTPTEEALSQIWAELLDLERVSANDHFFELGGHSLLATQVVARMRNAFSIEMPLRAIFEEPTVAGLAARVEAALCAGDREQEPPLVPVPREGPLPLSYAQQRLWILDEIRPGRPEYNFPVPLRLTGPLDLAALAASLAGIVRRHEVLRTTFDVIDGQPVQVIGPCPPLALTLVDLGGLPAGTREAVLARLAVAEAQRPFDLRRGPMFRATLLRLAAEEHALLLGLHHVAADGWSLQILLRDLAALYGAWATRRPPALPELPIQYADFAVWQRLWLEDNRLQRQLAWWRARLAGLPVLQLPTDRPRPPVQTSRGRHLPFALPSAESGALRKLAEREGATLFMVLLAAFATLLRQATGQDDLAVGTDVANRSRRETEDLIGFFVNQLVLRINAAGDPTFRELLGRVRETALAAYSYQDLPFERLVAALQPDRDLSRTPLFQVKLVLQTTPADSRLSPLPGISLRFLNVENETAKFDLLLNLSETPAGLIGELEYNVDLFDEPSVARLLDRFRMLLHNAADQPDARLSELSDFVTDAEATEREREFKQASRQRLRQVERRAVIGAAGN